MRLQKSGRKSVRSDTKLISEKIGKITFKPSPVRADGISMSAYSGAYGKINVSEIVERDYVLLRVEVKSKKDYEVKLSHKKCVLAWIFNLADEVAWYLNDGKEHLAFQYQHGLLYAPTLQSNFAFRAGKTYDFICMVFEPGFLLQWKIQGKLFKEFFQNIGSGEQAVLSSPRLYSTELSEILPTLFAPGKTFAPSIYREAKVLEVLHYAVENINSHSDKNGIIAQADRMMIQKVRQFLSKNFARRTTIRDLAMKFNTSAKSLGKKFADVNGVTIEDFIIQERMRKAYKLVIGTKISIGKIASLIGYEDLRMFNKDFKEQLGSSPSSLRTPLGRVLIKL